MAKKLKDPRELDEARLRRLGRYLIGNKRKVYFYLLQKDNKTTVGSSDSDSPADAEDRKSVSAGIEERGPVRHTSHHYSVTQQVHALSSAESGFDGTVLWQRTYYFRSIYSKNCLKVLSWWPWKATHRVQKGCVYGEVQEGHGNSEVRDLWIQDRVGRGEFQNHEIYGATNRADLGTKELAVQRFEFLLKLVQFGTEWAPHGATAALVLTISNLLSDPTHDSLVHALSCFL